MNYRHAYHAGNFADVLKHAVLALVIEHLKLKPQPFRVIDTHAGVGLYDLAGPEAEKTGEWRDGIGRILAHDLERPVAEILAPYLGVIKALNTGPDSAQSGPLRHYPGSPLLARRLMRPGDVLVVNELHPEDNQALRALFQRDPTTKVLALDGWTAIKSLLPPKERRGLVLVDPPYEEPGELERIKDGLAAAHRRFQTGTVMLWYPIKDPALIRTFHKDLAALGVQRLIVTEITIRERIPESDRLIGTGLVVLNPPFTLEQKLGILLPFLANVMAQGSGAGWRLEWIS